jgi:hypothetical protein
LIPLALALAGCVPDDYDGTWPDSDVEDSGDPVVDDTDDTDAPAGPAIVGTWVSEGDDLSELFAGEPFNYVRIEAYFRADGKCGSVIEDQDGQTAETAGTCILDDSTNPGSITIEQSSPYEATAKGIWRVSGTTLTYEVVQTVPDYGFTPPTPSTGFGSTSGPNLDSGVNVQTYRRAP